MDVRIACTTFPFQGLPLEHTLTRIRELGFAWADLSIHWDPLWGHLQPETVSKEPAAALERVQAAQARSRVKIASINLTTERFALSERGLVEAVCKLAQQAQIGLISVQAGGRDEIAERRRLMDFVELGKAHGVKFALETLEDTPYQDPARAAQAAAHDVAGLTITLDTGHLFCTGSPQESWTPLYPWVGHVHVKDAALSMSEYQVPVGRGLLDVPRLVRDLTGAGFDGIIVVEYIGPRPRNKYQFDAETESRKLRELLERALADQAR